MLDIRFIRENPELVRENIRKKFQDKKLPSWTRCWSSMRSCAAKTEANELRANRNALSKKIGMLMGQAKKDPPSWRKPRTSRPRSRARPRVWPSWKSSSRNTRRNSPNA